MGNDNQHVVKRVTPLWLIEHAEFVLSALEKIRRSKDTHTPVEVFKAVYKQLSNPNFSAWFQELCGVPVGFGAMFVTETLYGEREGNIWLMFCSPKASMEEFDRVILPWFKERGVCNLYAVDVDYTPAKGRWFRRRRFSESYRVFERKV